MEYWAHEASLIPPSTWPLLDFRMARAHELSWGGMQSVAKTHPALVEAVFAEVLRPRARSPPAALETALAHDLPRPRDQWGWNWSLVKNALEHLFWAGRITSAGRTSQFERRYAALERVLPGHLAAAVADPAARPAHDVAFKELILIAARAHGVGTEQCLRDYFRLKPEQARPALGALVAEGAWSRPRSRAGSARPTCTPRRAAHGRCTRRRCSARSTR